MYCTRTRDCRRLVASASLIIYFDCFTQTEARELRITSIRRTQRYRFLMRYPVVFRIAQ